MPAPELSHRYQTATLWAASVDTYDRPIADVEGQTKLESAVEIQVRWDDTKSEQVAPDGSKVVVDATVIVAQAIAIGSVMWLGKIADMPGTGVVPATMLHQVKTQNFKKDVKGRFTARTVGLLRIKDSLPTLS